MFDRRVDPLDERQLDQAGKVERIRRARQRVARRCQIQVELFLEALSHAVDRLLDHRFDVARIGRRNCFWMGFACAQSSNRISPASGSINSSAGRSMNTIVFGLS